MGSSQVVADRLIDPWSRSGRLDPGAVRMARTPSSAPPSGNGDDVLLVERENVHESFLGKENLNSRTRTEKTSGHRFWLEKRFEASWKTQSRSEYTLDQRQKRFGEAK